MKNETDNALLVKSFAFALRIIEVYQLLRDELNEIDLAKQILRSGTSIGANAEEAIGGHPGNDFFTKITTAYKESQETKYWLRLLHESKILDNDISESMLNDVDELLRITGSILKNTKANIE
ncbi:MAG: four helix bundle protein [Bacteroidetes bacterium]|nr:four helix bundle protein [Bacteroidota bacterium]